MTGVRPTDSPSTQSTPPESHLSRSDSSRHRPSRRTVLAAAGTAIVSSLAGCTVLSNSVDDPVFHDGDWYQYGNGPTNANHVAGGVPEPDEHTVLTSADWPYTPPAVHDGIAYFANERQVVAVATDGSERWSRRLDFEVSGVPALDPNHGHLYVPTRVVPTMDGPDPAPTFVTVLSLTDGEIIDTTRVGDGRTYGITTVDGDVYARCATACVRLGPDGTERWRCPLEPLIYDEYNLGDLTATQVTPAVTEDGVYIPDRDALVLLDRETGKERWRVPVDTAYAASVVDDDGVVQTGWQETVAINHSGDVRWRRDLQSTAAAAAADGDIYVVGNDLYELDAATGETNWQTHLSNEGIAAPVVTDETVLMTTSDVLAFRRDAGGIFGPDRERWEFSSITTSTYSTPVVADGRVFVAGPQGLVALWSGEDG